jgi:fumarylacetoacetase
MTPGDAKLKSFVTVAKDSPFPIQNLPYGVFTTPAN